MDLSDTQGENRVRTGILAVAVLGALVALTVGLLPGARISPLWLWSDRDLPDSISIAAGPKESPHYDLGHRLELLIEERFPQLKVGVFETVGGATNAMLLETGQAELGFVQNRPLEFPYPSLRTVARLYEEVLQIVVHSDRGIVNVMDLAGTQIKLGPCNSATRELTEGVFNHFDLAVHGWPGCSLKRHLQDNAALSRELDAVALLSGLPSRSVQDLLEKPGMRLLTLGEPERSGSSLEGLSFALKGTRPAQVPARTYGRLPQEPVGTIGVETLLATRDDVSERLVEEVTRLLFESRFHLSAEYPVMEQMKELPVEARLRFPVHPGAVNFYARNQPHPLVEWAEPLSLALAFVVSLASGLLGLRQWFRRTKKNRIDTFYLELERISDEIAAASSSEEIEVLEHRLYRLRKRAFRELVAERLQADESFSIFQTSLTHRLMEIAHRQASSLQPTGEKEQRS